MNITSVCGVWIGESMVYYMLLQGGGNCPSQQLPAGKNTAQQIRQADRVGEVITL